MADARAVLERADVLARCSEEPERLTRRFATPALAAARDVVAGWMRDAGLEPRVDAVGNLIGGRGKPGLLIGSHLDTVVDAGRYDGALGVLAGLALAERLPDLPLEVVAFADEEGVRFGTAYLGSAVLAGRFPASWLDRMDGDGTTMREAIALAGGDPDGAVAAAPRDDVRAYVEVHIEQGPRLEAAGRPVGVVTAIAGQTRAAATFTGRAGHAGTTPMGRARRDALAAAAEWIVAVEAAGVVATVGAATVDPGASNVIPGRVVATLDVRDADDAVRERAVAALREAARASGARRGVRVDWEAVQSTPATPCDPALTDRLAAAAGAGVPRLVSGAGHDAVMLSSIAPVAMLLVPCREGISHHPDEAAREEDVAVALDVLTRFAEAW